MLIQIKTGLGKIPQTHSSWRLKIYVLKSRSLPMSPPYKPLLCFCSQLYGSWNLFPTAVFTEPYFFPLKSKWSPHKYECCRSPRSWRWKNSESGVPQTPASGISFIFSFSWRRISKSSYISFDDPVHMNATRIDSPVTCKWCQCGIRCRSTRSTQSTDNAFLVRPSRCMYVT